MNPPPARVLSLIAALAAASLACQTITTLPERLRESGPRSQPTEAAIPAQPSEPAEPVEPPSVNETGPLTVGAGPTVGSPRETRIALAGDPIPDSLEDLAAEQYTSEQLNAVGARLTYTLALDQADTPLLWGYGWCATTPEILAQNLEAMRIEFAINGEIVDLAQFDQFLGQSSDGLVCQTYRALVYDWPAGDAELETRITFLAPLNDGLGDYPAGDQVFAYTVTAP